MRTRVVAAGGGDTGHFLVRRAVVDLLCGDLRVVEPLRPRSHRDLTSAGGHGGADGQTGTLQDRSRRPDTPLNGGLGKKHAVIQSGHLLPQGDVWPTYGHGSSLGRPPPTGQLVFPGDLWLISREMSSRSRGQPRDPDRPGAPGGHWPGAATGPRAKGSGRFLVAGSIRAAHRPARAASPLRQRFVTAALPSTGAASRHGPDEALLHDRHHQVAFLGEHLTAGQPPGADRHR